jgi:cytochrome c556
MRTDHVPSGLLVLVGSLLLVGTSLMAVSPPVASSASAVPADTVDTKPLRLLMVGLAQDMARINTGIWHEDYDLIREGASSIANHPKIPPDQIAKIKNALGEDFQNFVRYDKAVHGTATELVSAAKARDWSGVLSKYTEIRDGCVGCHTAYRDRLRSVLASSG